MPVIALGASDASEARWTAAVPQRPVGIRSR